MSEINIKKQSTASLRQKLYGIGALIEGAVIFALSVVPEFGEGINSGITAHGSSYVLLSFTLGLYFRSKHRSYPLLTAALASAGFGAIIELVQYTLPYRTCELSDIAINLCSALLAMIPGYFLQAKGWV